MPVLLWFASITKGVSVFPKEDCHDSQVYGLPGSERDVKNFTPNSENCSSSPSTMGAFD